MSTAESMHDWRKMDCEEYRRFRRRARVRNTLHGTKYMERVTEKNCTMIIENAKIKKIMSKEV